MYIVLLLVVGDAFLVQGGSLGGDGCLGRMETLDVTLLGIGAIRGRDVHGHDCLASNTIDTIINSAREI
jgi:hypothetical protein